MGKTTKSKLEKLKIYYEYDMNYRDARKRVVR